MKIVVLDGYTENPGDLSWDEMKKYGELTVYDLSLIHIYMIRFGSTYKKCVILRSRFFVDFMMLPPFFRNVFLGSQKDPRNT